jgi:prepilin peptidase CpaA
MTSYHFFLIAAVVVTLAAAYVDARTGHIPNSVTLGPLAVAPLAHALVTAAHTHAATPAVRSLGFSVLGALFSALLPLALYRSAGMGGGDVKLFAAVGAITNVVVGLHALTYAFVFGMVWALIVAARTNRLATTFGNVAALVGSPLRRPKGGGGAAAEGPPGPAMTRMPFGPAIFLGTLTAAVLLWSSK